MNKEDNVETKRISIAKILVLAFSLFVLASFASLYYAHQQPILERKIMTVASYSHKANYDYIAELKPNIIYNKTILRPGEGILYTALTDKINISFTYVFSSNPQPEALSVMVSRVTAKIESPDKWTKILQEEEVREFLNLNFRSAVNFTLEVNCALLKQIVNAIDKELGVYSQSYNVYIVPDVLVDAKIAERNVREVYRPQLMIMFKSNYILLEGLEQSQSREVKDVVEIAHPEVENQRTLSYAITMLAITGLATSTLAYHRVARHSRKKPSSFRDDKVAREHKDIIVETLTSSPKAQAIIEVKSLQELVKTAEILAKPILKAVDGEGQIFYVMDGSIKYQYKVQENKTSEM